MISLEKLTKFFSLVIASFLFACCSGGGKGTKGSEQSIRVGVQTGPEYEIAEQARKVAKEKYNLNVKLVVFSDFVMPNESLNNGDIDVNVFQHKPYLDVQSKQRGYKLAVVGNTFIYPMAAYSNKIKNVSDLPQGSTIVMPNDLTNGGRALLLLEKQGLIKLKSGTGLNPTANDIIENPHKLKILEIEAPQLTRVLDDKQVSIAIINNNFAGQAGLDPGKSIFIEDKDSPYVNVIVSREDNKNDEKVKQFVKAYQSDEVEKAARESFNGFAVKGW